MSNLVQNVRVLQTNGDFVQDFLKHKCENTKRSYGNAIMEFFSEKFNVQETWEVKEHMIQWVTPRIARDYISELISNGGSRSSVRGKRSALSSLFNEIVDIYEGRVISTNPWKNKTVIRLIDDALPSEEEEFNVENILTIQQCKQLLDKAKSYRRPKKYLVISVLLNCGLRRHEVGKIKWNDFRQMENEQGELEWRLKVIGKGGKKRWVFVHEKLANELIDYANTKNSEFAVSDKFVFGVCGDRINDIVKEVGEECGFLSIHAHCLRHTNITNLAKAGADITDLQIHAGHGNISTTRKYINYVQELRNCAGRLVTY